MLRQQRYIVADVRQLACYAWTHNITPGAHVRHMTTPRITALLRRSSFAKPRHRHVSSELSRTRPRALSFDLSADDSTSEHSESEDDSVPLHSTSEHDTSASSAAVAHKKFNRARGRQARQKPTQYAPMLEAGALPLDVLDEFTFFFPSRLRQQLLLVSPLFKRPRRQLHRRVAQAGHSTTSNMDTLAVLMPQNRYYCECVLDRF